jgi:hypothetical protein
MTFLVSGMGVALFLKMIYFFAEKNYSDTRECEKIHKPFFINGAFS